MSKLETGMIVWFDATTSGLQILSMATNDKTAMALSNVIPTYDKAGVCRRRDAYLEVTAEMYRYINPLDTILDPDPAKRRKQVKHPIMTTFYGSKQQPINLFGKDTRDLEAFYISIGILLKGPLELMELMQSCWQPGKAYHEWTMPITKAKVKIAVIDDLVGNVKMTIDGKEVKVPFHTKIKTGMDKGLSLAANITHSVDALIKDLVVMKFKRENRPIATIHDAFGVHPNDVALLMDTYQQALIQIYNGNVIQDILRQITGDLILEVPQINTGMFTLDLMRSKYAIC